VSALAGRTVVVTRARAQARAARAALEALGAQVLPFPTIALEPVADDAADRAVAGLGAYDWIAFTSANAVRFFWERLAAAGLASPQQQVRLAAVGEATAAALAERGARASAMPEVFLGTALADALGPLERRRVLLPRSDIGREETAAALRAAGAVVDEVVVYRTVPARPAPEAWRALEAGVDAVTFTSPSTVRGFLEAGGEAAARALRQAVIACIGPVTADAVRAAGAPVHVQPARHTAPALVDALEAHFASAVIAPIGGPR
jgi:uroporphyrinogen III methyltransferase/synthase